MVRALFLGFLCVGIFFENVEMRGFRSGGFRSGGFRSSSSRSGGWFSRSSSRSSSSVSRSNSWGSSRSASGSNNYPRQSWGSTGSVGSRTGGRTPIGGGGFVNPKPAGSNFGGGLSGSRTAFKPNPFGTKQYSGWSKPTKSFGSYSSGGKSYGYKTPGYGTNFGTNFAGGTGKYVAKKGFSKKALGLGIGAGFLGGAALGAAGAMATYSVYHRYHNFRQMMYMRNPGMYSDWDDNYYNNYYQK